MATRFIPLFQGGTPELKCLFCRPDWPTFRPPFSAPAYPGTPPYNSHADAAQGQGYLNLAFPLIPHLADTTGHYWMTKALHHAKAVGDVILTNWVPLRSFVTDLHWEVTQTDSALTGVYLKPVAYRVAFNFDKDEDDESAWTYSVNDDYATMLTNNGIGQFPLGTPEESDTLYGFAHNDNLKCTFGHNIPSVDATTGKPTGGFDEYFGAVLLGYEIAAGDEDKIALLEYAHFAIYFTSKVLTFEGPSQV